MKKICFVTATRAEYGLLKYLMKEVDRAEEFQLQVIVTGAHLMAEQGNTIDQIVADGIKIDRIVNASIDTTSTTSIAESMGRMAELMPKAYEELAPDYIVVLGDRYELMPICNSAFVMGIPIIHISGGDVTEGAIDDGIRNATTMLATYHFPGTENSAKNIMRMRGSFEHIWTVGETGLDIFRLEELMSREELAENLTLDIDTKWILYTYHAETKETLEYNLNAVKNSMEILLNLDGYQVVATYANADFGGRYINEYIESLREKYECRLRVVPSLGSKRYLSFMKQVAFMFGNSSSGIVEAPSLRVPVVNIGNRQKGRHLCSNIIQCNKIDAESIRRAVTSAISKPIDNSDIDYWGDGYASERIIKVMKDVL